MNYVEKLFDQVQSSLNLNAATLSGAIDILVIPQLDGSLKCTPFHVRFGKLQLISSSEKIVAIYVNGVKTDLQMKLGHAGEAFFVEETEEPVPSILATSPITSPKPGRVSKQSTEELVTEFMSSRVIPNPNNSIITTTTTTASITTNNNNSISNVISKPKKEIPSNKEMKSLTEALEEKIIQSEKKKNIPSIVNNNNNSDNEDLIINIDSPIGSFIVESPKSSINTAITTTTTTTASNITHEVASDSENEPKQWRWGGLPKFIRSKKPIVNEILEEPEHQLENNNNNNVNNNSVTEISSPLSSSSSLVSSSDDILVPNNSLDNPPPQGWTRSLLKMFNKKETVTSTTTLNTSTTITQTSVNTTTTTTTTTTADNSEPSYLVKQNPPITTSPSLKDGSPRVNNIIDGGEIFLLDEEQEEQERVQEQLQINNNADPLNSTYASMVKQQQDDININLNNNNDNKSPINISPELKPHKEINTPKLNDLKEFPPLFISNKKRHSMTNLLSQPIQLSLCGHLIQDKNLQNEPEEKELFFKEYLISFEQFSLDLSLLKNPHLVAKIGDHYYPWTVASHLILTQLIFNKPLPMESLDLLKSIDREERAQLAQSSQSSILSGSSSSSISLGNGSLGQSQQPIPQPVATPKPGWKWWWKSNNNNSSNDLKSNVQLPPSSSPININGNGQLDQHRRYSKKSLRPTSEQLMALGLKKGSNKITFSVKSTLQGTREVSASIYFWDNTSKIVISDIDGTITKSDVFGQVLPLIGKDWSHFGVAELYSNIKENGYQVIYLTSRAIGQAALTRTYISSVKQTGSTGVTTSNASTSIPSNVLIQSSLPNQNNVNNNNQNNLNSNSNNNQNSNLNNSNNLNTNPNPNNINLSNNLSNSSTLPNNNTTTVITTNQTNSSSIIQPLNTNSINNSTNIVSTAIPTLSHFKLPEGPVFMSPNRLLSSLNREVIKRNPEEFKIACLQDIQNIFPSGISPFYAGFGNRNTDAIAYNAVGVPKGKTFTINPNGVINTTNTTYNKTYTKLNDLVQDMFPCQTTKHSVNEQFHEYHYWKKSIIPLSQLDPL